MFALNLGISLTAIFIFYSPAFSIGVKTLNWIFILPCGGSSNDLDKMVFFVKIPIPPTNEKSPH